MAPKIQQEESNNGTASTSSTAENDNGFKLLKSAPPPSHSIAFVVAMISIFVYRIPSLASLDEDATVATFTHRVFPRLLSVKAMAWIRAVEAISVFVLSVYLTVTERGGWEQITTYLPSSKLRRYPNKVSGIRTQAPFTSWCWNLLGIAFALSSFVAFQADAAAHGEGKLDSASISPWILRLALITWEIAAPNAFLVGFVVRYGIWPKILQEGGDTTNLKKKRNFFMHNMNAVYVMVETALLGGVPVRAAHLSLAPLFGCVYILFAWWFSLHMNRDPKAGPQFLYFFLDTTVPGWFPTLALMTLLVALLLFFCVFCTVHPFLEWVESVLFLRTASLAAIEADGADAHAMVLLRALFAALFSSTVMRFRD